MGSLSPVHWLIVAVVVLLLFGPAKLAGMGRGLGEGMRSFRKGLTEDDAEPKPGEGPKVVAADDQPRGGAPEPASPPGNPEEQKS